MTFKCAVIGCGRIGCGFDDDPKRTFIATHAKAYTLLPETQLVALCDIDEEKAKRYAQKFNTSSYSDYNEMFKKEDIEILSICTLNDTHLPILRAAVSQCTNLKSIFCEKPISDSLKNAQEMIDLCKQHNILLVVDHQRRFDPFHSNVRTFIQEGGLGYLQQASFYYTAGISNTGSHMFDLLLFLFGEVEWVRAYMSKHESSNPNDPNIDGIMQFKNGGRATIQAIDVKNYLLFELDIIASRGRLKILNSGFRCEYFKIEPSEYYSGYAEPRKTEVPFAVDTPRDYMVNAIKHIIDCVKNKKEPISCGEDGKKALELIAAFHLSAQKDGEKLYLPIKEDSFKLKSR